MKNRFLLLTLLLTAVSCINTNRFYPKHGTTMTRFSNLNAYVNEADVTNAIKLKKKFPAETEFFADYIVKSYEFDYFADNLKRGNPIGVFEENFEKYTTLKDFVKFNKAEYFNDQINFDGFYILMGSNKNADYFKKDYYITNYQSGGIFYSDAKQAQYNTNLTVMGTNLRINYSSYIKDAKYLTSAYFLDGFPQKEKVITLAIPSYLTVEIIEKNFEGFTIEKSNKKYLIKDDKAKTDKTTIFVNGINGNKVRTSISKRKEGKEKLNYITYILKDAPAIKNERFEPGYSHNLPHIVILVKGINFDMAKPFSKPTPKEVIKEEERLAEIEKEAAKEANKLLAKSKIKVTAVVKKEVLKPVPLIANVNDLYAHYSQIANMSKNDTSVFVEKVKSITKDKTSDLEKIEAIFYWVQDNIRYVAFENGIAAFKPDNCQDVFNKRYGDCKGMANLLKNMLIVLGYDARLTWIGTKHLNYDYLTPSIVINNHMICTVLLNGKKYYLDGTESFIGIDDYADRIQGRQVMVENGKNFSIDTIPDLPADRNLRMRSAVFTLNENVIEGKMYETIKGENKTDILRAFHNAPLDKKGNVIKDIIDPDDIDIDVSNISSTDLSNRRIDINLNYDLTVSNHLLTVDNSIFLKPDFNREFSSYKVDSARFFDLQFDHKLNYAYDLTYNIPAGYKVGSVPPNISIVNPEFSLDLKYENLGNSIKYTKSMIFKNGKISKSNFKQWNEMIEKLRANYNQYIVLNK